MMTKNSQFHQAQMSEISRLHSVSLEMTGEDTFEERRQLDNNN